jgi:hypothetical protein
MPQYPQYPQNWPHGAGWGPAGPWASRGTAQTPWAARGAAVRRSADWPYLRDLAVACAGVIGVLVVVALAVAGANFGATSGGGSQMTLPPRPNATTEAATPSFAVEVAPTPVVPTPNVTMVGGFTQFGEGTYRVGTDIPPGTYRATDASDRCYWERIGHTTTSATDVVVNSQFMPGPAVVTISSTDSKFNSTDCRTWTNDLWHVAKRATSFGDGTYIVGIDVQPGKYTSPGGENCYWARVSGFGGTGDELLENRYGDSPAIVTIAATDKGVRSANCDKWTRT